MNKGEVKAAAFGAEATEAVDPAAEALVVAVASEDGDAVTESRSTTLPPAFLAPMAPPLKGIKPIESRETQLLPTFTNDKGQLAARLTSDQLLLCTSGRAMIRFGDYLPTV